MLDIRRSSNGLIFNMEIPIPGNAVFILRRGPDSLSRDWFAALIDDLGKRHYHKIFNIRGTKSQNLNDSRLVLQLSPSNPLKPGVKSGMNM